MRTTQRERFTINDIYENIEWATHKGSITFHTTKETGKHYYVCADTEKVIASQLFETEKEMVKSVNLFIRA